MKERVQASPVVPLTPPGILINKTGNDIRRAASPLYSRNVTDLEELRARNKMISARRSSVLTKEQKGEGNNNPDIKPKEDLEKQIQQIRREAKSEKLLRQKKNEVFYCVFNFDGFFKVEFQASCQLNIAEIKFNLLDLAKKKIEEFEEKKILTGLKLLPPDDYSVKSNGVEIYLTDERLPLHRLKFIQVCTKSYVTPQFELVKKSISKPHDEEVMGSRMNGEIHLGHQIATLIGPEYLSNFLSHENDEIADLRRSAIRVKLDIDRKKEEKRKGTLISPEEPSLSDERINYLPSYMIGEPMPLNMPEMLIIAVSFQGAGSMTTMVSIRPVERASKLLDVIFNKYVRTIGEKAVGLKVDNFILKFTGFQDYLYGENQLITYDHIRRCISKQEQIAVSLIPLVDLETTLCELTHSHHSFVDDLIAYEETNRKEIREEESIFKVNEKFKVSINSVERAIIRSDQAQEDMYLYIRAELYHSGHKLAEGFTLATPACSDPQWNELITFEEVKFKNIPKGTRIIFTLYHRKCDPTSAWTKGLDKNDEPLAWVATQVIDHNNKVKEGLSNFRMWVGSNVSPIGTAYQNLLQPNAPILFVNFPLIPTLKRVYYPIIEPHSALPNPIQINDETKLKLDSIVKADPLTPLDLEQKGLIWGNRHYLSNFPTSLPKFLLSVRWEDNFQVKEALRMLFLWTKPSPLQALELLDAKFADPTVRQYGVKCLEYIGDGELYDFMLQLTQVLKHEPHHNSALAIFLLRRAWNNPKIGHSFYWYLKAEMHLDDVAERYTILLEAYLRGAGKQRIELLKQNDVTSQLISTAQKIKTIPAVDRKKVLLESLAKLQFPPSFQLPLDQRMEVKSLVIEKCKYMDSKKLPLWLVWKNAEEIAPNILVIFKVGDDLRQDVLTLQMIKIFDKLWKNQGLDLLLKPYGCIATGNEIGMIEVVLNADTTANINKAAGGTKAVLKDDTLTKWLKQHNPQEKMKKAREIFLLSCAGYCVATYVLGIGDRHNDNIMLTKEGHLFHIDFGHFLGNYKKKYGIKRERAPFIFTPQYAHVLEGKNSDLFNNFINVCCRAFNILRRHSDMFITLFQMMLCTGIPELASQGDIEYLKEAFALGMSDDDAAKYFAKLINTSLNTKTTIINDAIHVFVHSK